MTYFIYDFLESENKENISMSHVLREQNLSRGLGKGKSISVLCHWVATLETDNTKASSLFFTLQTYFAPATRRNTICSSQIAMSDGILIRSSDRIAV